ncbi:MbtH family NRPS accessory protein [Nonomuraea angiospora]|uniref:MbtH family protein n=1 Tax=Nonomuraea angiospora TaxID=46172 RepID=UPI0033D51A38
MNDSRQFTAVVNDEEQYSIWPLHLPLPDGWRAVGAAGSKDDCLGYIEDAWTDMRPAGLRAAMADGPGS